MLRRFCDGLGMDALQELRHLREGSQKEIVGGRLFHPATRTSLRKQIASSCLWGLGMIGAMAGWAITTDRTSPPARWCGPTPIPCWQRSARWPWW